MRDYRQIVIIMSISIIMNWDAEIVARICRQLWYWDCDRRIEKSHRDVRIIRRWMSRVVGIVSGRLWLGDFLLFSLHLLRKKKYSPMREEEDFFLRAFVFWSKIESADWFWQYEMFWYYVFWIGSGSFFYEKSWWLYIFRRGKSGVI